MKKSIGTVPPIVRLRTGGAPQTRSSVRMSACDSGSVISVRYAFVDSTRLIRTICGYRARIVVVGFRVDQHMKSLRANVREDALQHPFRICLFDQPHVDLGGRAIRNDRARLFADVSAVEPADVQRRILQRLLKVVANLFGSADAEEAHQIARRIGHRGENLPFLGRERRHVLVEAADEHPAVRALHRCQQPRHIPCGIRRPVSVVAAMQREFRAERRELKHEIAAGAEVQRRLAVACSGPSRISMRSARYFSR